MTIAIRESDHPVLRVVDLTAMLRAGASTIGLVPVGSQLGRAGGAAPQDPEGNTVELKGPPCAPIAGQAP